MTDVMFVSEKMTSIFRCVLADPGLEIRDENGPQDFPGWDSLAHVKLVISIEEEFGIKFSVSEVLSFTSIGDIKRTVLSKIGSAV